MFDFFIKNWEIIAGMIGASVSWFTAWKLQENKSKANSDKEKAQLQSELEAKSAELQAVKADAAKKMVELYQGILDDLKNRYDQRFEDMDKEITALRKNVEMWKNRYKGLKKELEMYRAGNNKISSDGE